MSWFSTFTCIFALCQVCSHFLSSSFPSLSLVLYCSKFSFNHLWLHIIIFHLLSLLLSFHLSPLSLSNPFHPLSCLGDSISNLFFFFFSMNYLSCSIYLFFMVLHFIPTDEFLYFFILSMLSSSAFILSFFVIVFPLLNLPLSLNVLISFNQIFLADIFS